MRKTSVYLTDAEADALRRAAEISGQSQSELIRQGIREMTRAVGVEPRSFRSMGIGHGGGGRYESWNADEVYREVMGKPT